MRLEDLALRPVRAAARSSRVAGEAERTLDALFAGPLPEAVGRSLAEHHVLERVITEWLGTAAARGADGAELERLLERALASPALERFVAGGELGRVAETYSARLVQSPAFKRTLEDVLSSPELRAALTEQTTGFAAELAAAGRMRAGGRDDAVGSWARRALRRPRIGEETRFAGVVSRGIGLVVDAALAQVAFVAIVGSIALVVGLAGSLDPGWLAGTLTGAGWFLVVAAYFVGFWSATGQSPGMRLMGLRVLTEGGAPPSAVRSLVRFVGLILAIVPLFAGFLPALVDSRRRALQDYLAGTVVLYDRA